MGTHRGDVGSTPMRIMTALTVAATYSIMGSVLLLLILAPVLVVAALVLAVVLLA